jgi:hypothetical protein
MALAATAAVWLCAAVLGATALPCAAAPPAAVAPPAAAAPRSGASPYGPVRRLPALTADQQGYLALAERGVAEAKRHWADRRRHWYDARLGDRDRFPLATIWDSVPLFESLDAIAIAQPTRANLAAVARFAAGAERYLNHGLRPVAGYSPYPGDREPGTETWFDDNGWWGLAFMNAYRATGSRRYLHDAERALRYVAAAGWDPVSGGIWWNTTHPYKAGEALASATLLATLIYQRTGSSFALAQARRYLQWANSSGFSAADGLYAGSNLDPTPIDYIEAPLIYAQALLCRLPAAPGAPAAGGDCSLPERLKQTALDRFGYLLDFAPQYDAIYLQWMLALYALDGDPTLYRLAADNARDARTRAPNANGLYLLSWNGEVLPARYAQPGMLQTQAATTSVFAWLATYRAPAR